MEPIVSGVSCIVLSSIKASLCSHRFYDGAHRRCDLRWNLLLQKMASLSFRDFRHGEQLLDPGAHAAQHRIAIAPHDGRGAAERFHELLAATKRLDRRMFE